MGRVWAFCVVIILAGTAGAQQRNDTADIAMPDGQMAPAILTMDVDRLFARSQFGERIRREYQEGSEALANENGIISDALRREELALAAQRPSMDPALFRTEAEAFDDKAQGIRRAQDAKRRDLEETLNTGREQFLLVTGPILEKLLLDSGASAILERRTVVISLGTIDVTDVAVERINAAIGDGAGLADDVGVPDTSAQPTE
ncbi:OmpH family outer membrane protein [Octadecabacter sp.]|nr:OmpH family outer membrane protein [Octadecabacter sp.]